MGTPSDSGPARLPGREADWLVLTASERGASHLATHTPNQDAVAAQPVGQDGVVAAVADGHGHWRHLRSARGSRIAAAIGCTVGQELADRLEREKILDRQQDDQPDGPTLASVVAALVGDFAVPAVIDRWREAVLADLAADPFSDAEQDQRQAGDDATVAYGSTLLLAVTMREWLILAQIGDGDVVAVRADGSASLPVPTDPLLDGLVTTSLCGSDPRSDFRISVTDTSADPLLAVMLATDGYGNAQVIENWPSAFSSDLAWLIRNRDEHWLASQLPAWAARCASSEGSADDTTVALLVSPAGLEALAAAPAGAPTTPVARDFDVGSEETTIPAVLRSDTVPSEQVPPGLHPVEPVTTRYRNPSELFSADPVEADAEPPATPSPATPSPATPSPATLDGNSHEQTTLRWKPPWKARTHMKPPDSPTGASAL